MALTNDQIKQDRSRRFGGSDFPALMGDSKFKTPWELLLEKARLVELEEKHNAYISFGNITEPFVQDKMGTTNKDEMEYKNEEFYLPIVGHIDGIREKDNALIEIKASSGDLDKVHNEYKAQLQMYMKLTGLKKAELHLLQRVEDVKVVFDNATSEMFADWEKEYTSEEEKASVEQKMQEGMESFKLLKKHIKVKKVKYDDQYQFEIEEKLNIFCKYLEMLENDPFIDLEQLEIEFNKEMSGKFDVVDYDTSLIEHYENELLKMKSIKEALEKEKAKLLEFMQVNDIKKIDNDKFAITRVDETTRKSFDSKKFKEENPALYGKYQKESKVKASVKIKIK